MCTTHGHFTHIHGVMFPYKVLHIGFSDKTSPIMHYANSLHIDRHGESNSLQRVRQAEFRLTHAILRTLRRKPSGRATQLNKSQIHMAISTLVRRPALMPANCRVTRGD